MSNKSTILKLSKPFWGHCLWQKNVSVMGFFRILWYVSFLTFPLQINSTTTEVIQYQYQTKHRITSYVGFLINLNTGLVCGSMCLPNIEWCPTWMFRLLGLCYTSTCGSSSPTDRCLVLSSQPLPCIFTYYPDIRKFQACLPPPPTHCSPPPFSCSP